MTLKTSRAMAATIPAACHTLSTTTVLRGNWTSTVKCSNLSLGGADPTTSGEQCGETNVGQSNSSKPPVLVRVLRPRRCVHVTTRSDDDAGDKFNLSATPNWIRMIIIISHTLTIMLCFLRKTKIYTRLCIPMNN